MFIVLIFAVVDAELVQVAATMAEEAAKTLKKQAAKSKQETLHLFAKTPSEESIESRIKNWSDKINKLQARLLALCDWWDTRQARDAFLL